MNSISELDKLDGGQYILTVLGDGTENFIKYDKSSNLDNVVGWDYCNCEHNLLWGVTRGIKN